MSIGCLIWHSKLYLVEAPTKLLYFTNKLWERLTANIQTFQGSLRTDLVKFTTPKLAIVIIIIPDLIEEKDVSPNSVREKWLPWMREEIQNNVYSSILTSCGWRSKITQRWVQ